MPEQVEKFLFPELDMFSQEKEPEEEEIEMDVPDPDEDIDIFAYQHEPGKTEPEAEDQLQAFTELQQRIADLACDYLSHFGVPFKAFSPLAKESEYDRVLIPQQGRWRIEIKSLPGRQLHRHGTIAVNYLREYVMNPGAEKGEYAKAKSKRVFGQDIADFLSSIAVKKYGSLFETEAHSLVVYCAYPVDKLWIMSTAKLIENRVYFAEKYGVCVDEREGEGPLSCFVPIPIDDAKFQSCGVEIAGATAYSK